jgi:regulator of sirC expression with transglutaminase-like and TPR domain
LLLAGTAACHGSRPDRWRFARAAASVAQSAGGFGDAGAGLFDQLETMAARVERRGAEPAAAATALARGLFEDFGFVREVDSTDLRFVLLPGVLRHRRGNCVGLGVLYLALAEALGFKAHGVLMPGHFYVQQRGPGAPRNVELLRRGEAMSDAWYRWRFPPPSAAARYYATPLSNEQVLGVVEYDVGNERRRQKHLSEARAAYLRAVRLFPTFAEAHASLGTVQHLLGELRSAASSYRAARALNPHLPGLDANVQLLDAELLQGAEATEAAAEE